MAKKALGRGLEALIPKGELEFLEAGTKMIDVNRIKPNPYQPRSEIKEEDLRSLVNSIKTDGIIQPVAVRKKGDEYQLIVGERRFRAAKVAGLKEIPATLRNVSDLEMLKFALIENLERKDLNAVEQAGAFKRLIEEFGFTQQQVGESVGKDRSTVTNVIRLLSLPKKIREYIEQNRISEGHARALLSLGERPEVLILGEKIVSEHLSVREIERMVRRVIHKRTKKSADPDIEQMAESLRRKFGTKVKIVWYKSRGRIVIHVFTASDLEKLFSQLMGR